MTRIGAKAPCAISRIDARRAVSALVAGSNSNRLSKKVMPSQFSIAPPYPPGTATGGSPGKLTRTAQCEDRFEATIDAQMMTAFKTTAEQLKSLCKWK